MQQKQKLDMGSRCRRLLALVMKLKMLVMKQMRTNSALGYNMP